MGRGEAESGAAISECGLYRFELWRRGLADGPRAVFVLLNPSKADASNDDPTTRRCLAFAEREGCGPVVIVNLFAWRATSPRNLWAAVQRARVGPLSGRGPDPVGDPGSTVHTIRAMLGARDTGGVVVAGWGAAPTNYLARERFGDRVRRVKSLARQHGVELRCLGRTKGGDPRHPLYVRADRPLVSLENSTPGGAGP